MALWPQIAPLLIPALERTKTHDMEDVRKALMVQAAHLWIEIDKIVDAFMVTEFVNYPKGLFVRVWLAGARSGADMDWHAARGAVEVFKDTNHAIGLEVIGRKGWLGHFPDAHDCGFVMRTA